MIDVKTFVVGELQTNCYLLTDSDTSLCALIDPGDMSQQLESAVEKAQNRLEYILLTHGHFDHIGCVPQLVKKYSPKVLIGENEKALLNRDMCNLSAFHNVDIEPFAVEKYLKDNESFMLGNTKITFIETPGHTIGGGCYLVDDVMFSGDTLFCESVGRTDLPTGDTAALMSSLSRLSKLQKDYTVYPGHDCATTLEHEKKYNPYMR